MDDQGGLKEEVALGGSGRTQPSHVCRRGVGDCSRETHFLVIMSLLAAPGVWEWKAFKTVTSGKQIHIFDKRPDDRTLAAHQI